MNRRADRTGPALLRGRLRRCVHEPAAGDQALAASLARLQELQARNLITEREYRRARQRILGG